ncbi:hypothetical protein ACHAXS_012439, partial [Conticribra weissflogii]
MNKSLELSILGICVLETEINGALIGCEVRWRIGTILGIGSTLLLSSIVRVASFFLNL